MSRLACIILSAVCMFKPLPPLICAKPVGTCICDENGNNCKWYWVCQD